MAERAEIIRQLRDRIVGELHVGHLRAGQRLPSVRDVAAGMKKNPRTVRAAYRALEAEGLVKVRGRSGVFVANYEMVGSAPSQEIAQWMCTIVTEAWKRRIPPHDIAEIVERYTTANRVRCALVEVVEDAKVALEYELTNDWGFDVSVVSPDDLSVNVAAFERVDFFAATSFFAPFVHDAIAALNKPLVVLTIHDSLQEAIRQRIRNGRLTVVAADARFADRIRTAYATDGRESDAIQLVLANDHESLVRLDPNEAVLLTRAARKLIGPLKVPSILSHSPTLSVATANALASLLVRKNRMSTLGL